MRKITSILDVENYLEGINGVIFDLDDTLYSEKQYVISGFRKIADFLELSDAEIKLRDYFENQEPAIDKYLAEINSLSLKDKCIDIYRSQMPDITLYNGVIDMLFRLRKLGKKTGIITDGRVEGQKNKIIALGLDRIVDDIIITDELGGIEFRKPNDTAFRIMQDRWQIPFDQMVYIGDNLRKDFQAPKRLKMKCLFFKNVNSLYF